MTPRIIDSHVHLWPEEMANEDGHAWMTPGMPLAKPQLLSHYRAAAIEAEGSSAEAGLDGVVYVETDVRYDEPRGDIATWARGPLNEIEFLRRVIEGHYDGRDTALLQGLVLWAPMDQPTPILEQYLSLAETAAGPEAWARVKGFRFLLQFIHDKNKFGELVLGNSFLANLKILGSRGFSFDVGVDQRSGGVWQLEIVAQAMQMAHQDVAEDSKITFIVNHLCKPDFEADRETFQRWCEAITSMSRLSRTFMKISGAFSELPSRLQDAQDVAQHMRPWIGQVLKSFTPRRTMFGSDWPVCNVSRPRGEQSWVIWREVVAAVLKDEEHRISERDREWIWAGSARTAYRLDAMSRAPA